MAIYLDRLIAERTSLTGVLAGMRERAANDDRDLTDAERAEAGRLQERAAAIDTQLTEHAEQAASARAFAELTTRIEATREPGSGLEARAPELTTPGRRFVESEAFRGYSGRGKGLAVAVPDYLESRAAITTANLAIQPYVLAPGEIVSRAPLLDVMNRVTVSSGVVEWVEVGGDPVAAVVAEGALKPEAALTFTPATASLDTIAHWVQITRQALDDASYIRTMIEGKLRRGLLAKIEADAAAMLAASTAIQTATDADLLTAIRIGIGKIEAAGYRPNAVVMNPADYAAIDVALMQETNGGATRNTSVWGLPVVPDSSIPAGSAYPGDYSEAMTLFDRGVTDVFLSDSHADLFIRNILVILAEARVKVAITDPLGICESTASAA